MDKNMNEDQIDEIVHMLDEFSDSDNKRLKISTSDSLKEGEKKKTDILSKYDKTDPFVADIASIPGSKNKWKKDRSEHKNPFNFNFFNLK